MSVGPGTRASCADRRSQAPGGNRALARNRGLGDFWKGGA